METMVDEVEKEGSTVNEERAVELILNLLIVSYETTSTITGLAVKFIAENPKVLMELKVECSVKKQEVTSFILFLFTNQNEMLNYVKQRACHNPSKQR